MEFLNKILAQFFAKFKSKNPTLAAAILLLLGSVIYWAENGLGDIIGKDLSGIVQWVSIALAALTGAHTTEILEEKKKG